MNLIKKFAIFSLMPYFYFSNFSSSQITCTAEEKNNSGVSFKTILDYDIEGEKLNIKICAFLEAERDVNLENLEVVIIFDKRIFKFIKKYFDFSDNFKIKIEDINENDKILKIYAKNDEIISLSKDSNEEIFNFDLIIKRKLTVYESYIKILISCDNIKHEETKHIKIPDKNQIENIIINSKIEDLNFKFDKNMHKYSLSVPSDEKYIIFDLETIDKNKKLIKKKLKKPGSTTFIRIGNYEFEVFRNEKKKSDKKIKKIKNKKTTKSKKEKSRKNKKAKQENCESFDEYEEGSKDEQFGIQQRENNENQRNNEYYTKMSEETLKDNGKNNDKLIFNIIISIIAVILILFLIFFKKIKNKKTMIFKNKNDK